VKGRKLFVIGLDSVPPSILMGSLRDELPNISTLMEEGASGTLHSCHPPITIPAWMVMMTGKSPGRLGLYGFRHRKGFSYTEGWIASSHSVKEKTLWDYVGESGGSSCVIGVPPSYPPKPTNGYVVSCFITPGAQSAYTFPSELKNEIQQLVGEYMFDVVFRTEDRDKLLHELYAMTEKRFKVVRHFMDKKAWKFFMFMEIGTDRLHHAFWKFYDKAHPKYEAGNRYEGVIPHYYRYIDREVGELLKKLDKDTIVLLVSDHGTKGMQGAFCVNEWLIQEGYLSLNTYPGSQTELDKADVNWEKTKAWGWGGYYARIFLNVKGREPRGVIPQAEYEGFRDQLAIELKRVRDANGRVMNTQVHKPEELYPVCIGDKPDLMVYFDNLDYRSAGTIGHKSLYLSENDTGPDDSVHSMEGVFVLHDPEETLAPRSLGSVEITDVSPALARLIGLPPPDVAEGHPRLGALWV